MGEFDGRDFSALAHALGALHLRPPGREWMAAFWKHSQGHLQHCSARELSTMLWGLGGWGTWWGRMSERNTSEGQPQQIFLKIG